MFFPGHGVYLRFEHAQRFDQTNPRFSRFYNIVDIAMFRRHEWTGEALVKFGDFLGSD